MSKNIVKQLASKFKADVLTNSINSDISYRYPFNCSPIDILFGGGVPSGKIIEMFGRESVGKSTFALEMSKCFTDYWKDKKEDCMVVWLESESAFDKTRALYIGCDLDKYIYKEITILEDGFNLINEIIDTLKKEKSKVKLFFVWDTIAAVSTKNELDDSAGMMEKPRVLKKRLRELSSKLGEMDTTLILVNQVYKKITGFKPSDESPGGIGIKFHSSIRIHITLKDRINTIAKDGSEKTVAIVSNLNSIKNKVTVPGQKINIYIYTEKGLDRFNTLYEYCVDNKIFESSTSWKTLIFEGEEYKFQNSDKLKEICESNPKLIDYLNYRIYKNFTDDNPLMKFHLIDKLLNYENQLYNEKRTQMTSEEVNIAKSLYTDWKAKGWEVENDKNI